MKIFITGGTGFIGRHTVEALQAHGHKLLILTRKKEPRSIFQSTKSIKFLRGGLKNLAQWKKRVRNFRPDVVLHLAWEGIPDYSPVVSIKNLKNGLDLVGLAASVCKRIVCVGSDKEYGITAGRVDETAGLHPTSSFSAAKTAVHWIGKEIAGSKGIQFVWARIFFAYGPGQRPAALVPYLARCIKSGETPEIRNIDGANDFVYVGDVARALRALVEERIPGEYAVYNIASGRLTSVRDVVNFAYGRKLSGRRPKRNSGSYADISKIKKEIGWAPKTDIKSGVRKTIAYYKRQET